MGGEKKTLRKWKHKRDFVVERSMQNKRTLRKSRQTSTNKAQPSLWCGREKKPLPKWVVENIPNKGLFSLVKNMERIRYSVPQIGLVFSTNPFSVLSSANFYKPPSSILPTLFPLFYRSVYWNLSMWWYNI